MSFSWKILAASAAIAALLSGCSSVSLDESAKDGTLAGQTAGSQTQAVNRRSEQPALQALRVLLLRLL